MLFCIVIVSNILHHEPLEPKAIFLVRGIVILLIFVWVMYNSPIIFKPFGDEGGGTLPFIWGIMGIIGGIFVARAALVLEFQGGSRGQDLIYLTFFYSVCIILLAQPIAKTLKKGRMVSSRDRLEKGTWGFNDYESWLKKDESLVLDKRGETIAKRLRDNVLYLIDSDEDIGSSGKKETYAMGKWLRVEISSFALRNTEHLPQRLTGRIETQKFSHIDVVDYITREVSEEFENKLLINAAEGTEKFRGVRDGGVHLVRNLISQLGLHDEIRDQRIGLENGEEILKRQMAIFTHIFCLVFSRKVGRRDSRKSIGMAEGKMIVRGLMQYLIEKNGEFADESESIWEIYPRVVSSPPSVGDETVKDIDDFLQKIPLLDLGISRLDHGIDQGTSVVDDSPLSSFVSACLDFFHEGKRNQEV